MNNQENLNNNSNCEKCKENRQPSAARIGRISLLSRVLAEKALIDEYKLLPEDLVDNENNYLPEYQDYFYNYYDYYYNELMSYIKF